LLKRDSAVHWMIATRCTNIWHTSLANKKNDQTTGVSRMLNTNLNVAAR